MGSGEVPWRPEPGEILTVTDLLARARTVMEATFGSVWVEGELGNTRVPSSGHAYFTVGDGGAQVRAVCFRTTLRLLGVSPSDGLRALVRGRLTVYEPRGDLQLLVEDLEPLGDGLLRLALEALKRRLAAEGLFDASRKRPLPLLPRGVGVVTSQTGAALRDVLKVLERRAPGVAVYLAPARVQGDGAAEELRQALALVCSHPSVEVVILGRGGGSAEDLSAFNDEALVRAVAASPVPVIAAVGHEIDVTLVDHAADARAPTPSAAAELAVREWAQWSDKLSAAESALASAQLRRLSRLGRAVDRLDPALRSPLARIHRLRVRVDRAAEALDSAVLRGLRQGRLRLAGAEAKLAHLAPERRLGAAGARVGRLEERLAAHAGAAIEARRKALALLRSRVEGLNPLAILARGYAVARKGPEVLRDASRCVPGDDVTVLLAHGALDCSVLRARPQGR